MTVLHRLDTFLLDRVAQPCADWLSQNVGISPYRLATNLFLASAAVEIPRMALNLQRGSYAAALFGGLVLLMDTIYAHRANSMDGRKVAGMNHERVVDFMFRSLSTLGTAVGTVMSLILLALGQYLLLDAIRDVSNLTFLAGLFFVAVNRPPPRVRHVIETKLATARGAA
ncbi:hypothetical protein [Azospirillum sp. TSO5]|uniref:hypothetical protein n=1 Tax=Azospirillum sp. TSO5 TaxID=716760 RepID=UPI000D61A6D6|nr:hypothetical protein [Azospirillum sp. TSO5]PWC98067.1 hypothetical protein TSO5_03445 [Azospirillum sp. TSO5]